MRSGPQSAGRRTGPQRRSGQALVEFTLVGIPMIFLLISIFEIARITWIYNNLSAATAEATRYAIVHGRNCVSSPNSCGRTVADVAGFFRFRAVGLAPEDTTLSLISPAGTVSCRLDQCPSNSNIWPPLTANEVGTRVELSAIYTTRSPLSMLWPGGHSVAPFSMRLGATSREPIQF